MINFNLFSLRASNVQNGRIRFDVTLFNKRFPGLVALRSTKYRFGVSGGETFKQAHLGKVSIGLEKKKPAPGRQLWNWI